MGRMGTMRIMQNISAWPIRIIVQYFSLANAETFCIIPIIPILHMFCGNAALCPYLPNPSIGLPTSTTGIPS